MAEPIIPGLPDDIAMECLLKVPITSHPTLTLVSHLWNSAISDPSFYTHRRRQGSAERLLFLLSPLPQTPLTLGDDHECLHGLSSFEQHQQLPKCVPLENVSECNSVSLPAFTEAGSKRLSYNLTIFNLTRREWQRLALPIPAFAQCVAVPAVRTVVVLGGWDPDTLEPSSRVLVIDLAKGTWKEGSPMPVARSFFACAAAGEETVYVAGGHDRLKNALRSAAAYDVVSDRWRSLPDMSEGRDECHGLSFLEQQQLPKCVSVSLLDARRSSGCNNITFAHAGSKRLSKFWVISGYGTENQGVFRSDCEVFDPETESWTRVESVWPYPRVAPRTTTVTGQRWLYVGEGEVREFDWEEKRWNGVNSGRVPKKISGSSSNLLVNVGEGDNDNDNEKIFVMGNNNNNNDNNNNNNNNGDNNSCEGKCDEEGCGGEGVFILEKTSNSKGCGANWKHVHAPCGFLGFPFSASQLYL